MADSVTVLDTFDQGKLLHHALSVDAAAVIAVDDYRLIPAAVTAEALGLPHADVVGLVNAHFKDRARALTFGVGRQVRSVLVPRDTPVTRSPIGYPCVVKPLDDSGSTGVTVCLSDADFTEAQRRAREVRRNMRSYECAPQLLVEEFVDGEEFTAECMWDNTRERWQLLGYTKKLLGPPPSPVETGAIFPHWFADEQDAQIEALVYGWLDAVGHRGGAAHVEFKVSDEGTALIEINPRLGGDQIRDLIRITGGVDPVELYLDLALGEAVRVERVRTRNHVAASFYKLPPRPGEVLEVRPPDVDTPGVVRHCLASSPMTITGVRDNDDRLGYVITQARDRATCLARAEDFMAKVDVRYAS